MVATDRGLLIVILMPKLAVNDITADHDMANLFDADRMVDLEFLLQDY
jgi:phage terminase large subunit-like protein